MYVDRPLASAIRARTARDHGVDLVLDAWSGAPKDRRAAVITAQGDLARAASYAGGPWLKLLDGDIKGALEEARNARSAVGMAILEAEALFAAGAVVAGLECLEALHLRNDASGTLALARRRHQLGDHDGAVAAAQTLPLHAHAALTGARSALMSGRPGMALRFVEPYLLGHAPLPEPAVAGAMTMTTAAILAKLREHAQLRQFVDGVLGAGDLAEDMKPAVARAGWMAGLARQAWHRFDADEGPWGAAGQLELAVLAGDAPLAERLLKRAGPLGAPSAVAVQLLKGTPANTPRQGRYLTESAEKVFANGRTVHIWRTHPHRWQPWIEAALRTPANVGVYDLAAGKLPSVSELPDALMDDGALFESLVPLRRQPVPVQPDPGPGSGIRVASDLCSGVGIGHDWPDGETEALRQALSTRAAVVSGLAVVNADEALAAGSSGRPLVVVAPPGDPFWAGPLPELVWPALKVVRASPQVGWKGAGERVADALATWSQFQGQPTLPVRTPPATRPSAAQVPTEPAGGTDGSDARGAAEAASGAAEAASGAADVASGTVEAESAVESSRSERPSGSVLAKTPEQAASGSTERRQVPRAAAPADVPGQRRLDRGPGKPATASRSSPSGRQPSVVADRMPVASSRAGTQSGASKPGARTGDRQSAEAPKARPTASRQRQGGPSSRPAPTKRRQGATGPEQPRQAAPKGTEGTAPMTRSATEKAVDQIELDPVETAKETVRSAAQGAGEPSTGSRGGAGTAPVRQASSTDDGGTTR